MQALYDTELPLLLLKLKELKVRNLNRMGYVYLRTCSQNLPRHPS